MTDKRQLTSNPYLTFGGNCREAMEFYQKALRGNLDVNTFEGAPMDVPEAQKDKIMHAALTFGDAVLMASDGMSPDQTVDYGNGFAISLAPVDPVEAERIFNELSAGGQVIMAFQDTFWGAKFGQFIDKFGVRWMVNCELKKT